MKTIAISEFKAKCLAVMEEVRNSGEPVLVTKRGKPIVQVSAPPPDDFASWMGSWSGRVRILGDIVAPACPPEDWEALGAGPYGGFDDADDEGAATPKGR